jgi:hypothetical protein
MAGSDNVTDTAVVKALIASTSMFTAALTLE